MPRQRELEDDSSSLASAYKEDWFLTGTEAVGSQVSSLSFSEVYKGKAFLVMSVSTRD